MFSSKALKAISGVIFLVLLVIGLTACSGNNSPNYMGAPHTNSDARNR